MRHRPLTGCSDLGYMNAIVADQQIISIRSAPARETTLLALDRNSAP
jgi:hypothetical protein